jgi:alkylhydroperoxidase/carboxymuconolactone decarboxylase family protein YurZ
MQPPKQLQKFTKTYPKVAKAYDALGTAVHGAGPLDEQTRALVKLGISTGARLEGAVHSHVRKALAIGVKPDALRHAVLLALPTIGLPSMMAAMSWVEDVLGEVGRKGKIKNVKVKK